MKKLLLLTLITVGAYGSISVTDTKCVHNECTVVFLESDTNVACSIQVADMNLPVFVSSATGSGTAVTVNTRGLYHLFAVGTVVYVRGTGVSQWEGWQTVATVPSATSFTFSNATSGTYTAPGSGPWALIGQLVNDVNPALFTNADLFSRGGNYSVGQRREFTVGKPYWDVSLGNLHISRALQVDSDHVGKLVCGGDTANFTMRTNTIPLGNASMVDYVRSHPNIPGASIADITWDMRGHWEKAAQNYVNLERNIEPLSGMMYTNGTAAGEYLRVFDMNFSTASLFVPAVTPTGWTNTATILDPALTCTPYTTCATYTGSGKDILLIRGINSTDRASYQPDGLDSIDFIRLYLVGASGAGATQAARDIEVAMTMNGVDPLTNWVTFNLPATGSPCAKGDNTCTFPQGTNNPKAAFQDWLNPGAFVPTTVNISVAKGTSLKSDGTDIVTINSNGFTEDFFKDYWVNGSTLRIGSNSSCVGGIEYKILKFINQTTLQMQTTVPAGTGQQYCGQQFGYMIRKKTTSTDAITIKYFDGDIGISQQPQVDASSTRRLSENSIPDGNGNPGYLAQRDSNLYYVAKDTAESRYISGLWQSGFSTFCGTDLATTSSANAADMLCVPNGISVRSQYHWTGSTAWSALPVPTFDNLTDCVNPATPNPNPCVERTNLTAPYSFTDLMHDFNNAYNVTLFPSCGIRQVQSHYTILWCRATQDAVAWLGMYDVTKPISSYVPGVRSTNPIVAAVYTGQSGLWMTRVHFADLLGPKTIGFTLKSGRQDHYPGSPSGGTTQGQGPWRMNIVKVNGVAGSAINTTTDVYTCPANTLGLVNCTDITIDSEPFVPVPAGAETGAAGEYGQLLVGGATMLVRCDTLISEDSSTYDGNCWNSQASGNLVEYTRVLSKSGSAPLINLTIGRGLASRGTMAHLTGTRLYTSAISDDNVATESSALSVWDPINCPDGTPYTTCISNSSRDGNHSGVSSICYGDRIAGGLEASCPWTIPNNNGIGVQARSEDPFGSFNYKAGLRFGNTVEFYAGLNQTDFPANDVRKLFMLNSSPIYQDTPGPDLTIAFDQVPGTTYIWRARNLRKPITNEWPYRFFKMLPMSVAWGSKPLLEVSSPTVQLTDTQGDNFKQCIPMHKDECWPGSKPHETYVNVPYVTDTQTPIAIASLPPAGGTTGAVFNVADGLTAKDCAIGGGTDKHVCLSTGSNYTFQAYGHTACDTLYNREIMDLCVSKVDPFSGTNARYVWGLSSNFSYDRDFQKLGWAWVFGGSKFGGYHAGKVFPDGNWIGPLTSAWGQNRQRTSQWYGKVPLVPAKDYLDRLFWVPMEISIGSTPPGTVAAQIEYGYRTYGADPASGIYRCTGRRENCIATSQKYPRAYGRLDGLSITSPDYENQRVYSGVSCTGTTTITCNKTDHGFGNDSKVFGMAGAPCEVTVVDKDNFTLNTCSGTPVASTADIKYWQEDAPFLFGSDGCSIAGGTGAGVLIGIRCTNEHHLQTGNRVFISGVTGNTNANGFWTVTVTGLATMTLDGSTGNGTTSASGTVVPGGESCASGCKVTLPTKSNMTMYYRINYLDSLGQVINPGVYSNRFETVATR